MTGLHIETSQTDDSEKKSEETLRSDIYKKTPEEISQDRLKIQEIIEEKPNDFDEGFISDYELYEDEEQILFTVEYNSSSIGYICIPLTGCKTQEKSKDVEIFEERCETPIHKPDQYVGTRVFFVSDNRYQLRCFIPTLRHMILRKLTYDNLLLVASVTCSLGIISVAIDLYLFFFMVCISGLIGIIAGYIDSCDKKSYNTYKIYER